MQAPCNVCFLVKRPWIEPDLSGYTNGVVHHQGMGLASSKAAFVFHQRYTSVRIGLRGKILCTSESGANRGHRPPK
jgi:hypothetical protein